MWLSSWGGACLRRDLSRREGVRRVRRASGAPGGRACAENPAPNGHPCACCIRCSRKPGCDRNCARSALRARRGRGTAPYWECSQAVVGGWRTLWHLVFQRVAGGPDDKSKDEFGWPTRRDYVSGFFCLVSSTAIPWHVAGRKSRAIGDSPPAPSPTPLL